uniref:Uncharacterized protein n=1 Tax=Sphaerodactylus townsendi TaxID=933632 RepID=A0ACB8FBP6_9SAUR
MSIAVWPEEDFEVSDLLREAGELASIAPLLAVVFLLQTGTILLQLLEKCLALLISSYRQGLALSFLVLQQAVMHFLKFKSGLFQGGPLCFTKLLLALIPGLLQQDAKIQWGRTAGSLEPSFHE